jgi:hypothetical protein
VSLLTYEILSRYPLRAGDSIQLASCLYLRERSGISLRFVGYDTRLNDVVRELGLEVLG